MQEKEPKTYCKFQGASLEYRNIFFDLIILQMRLDYNSVLTIDSENYKHRKDSMS